MKRYATVEAAVVLVVKNLEANHIACNTENTECIRNRVYSWYSHSDVTDPEMLAACALLGTDWFPEATYKMMVDAKNYWFPKNPYDEISIWEIEAAQHDTIQWK